MILTLRCESVPLKPLKSTRTLSKACSLLLATSVIQFESQVRCHFLFAVKYHQSLTVSIPFLAYSKIAQQSSIVNFTPKDRITLIMNGLNERVDNVREVFLTQLIPNWIKGLDNGIIGFLDNLDIKRNLPLARQFLTTYFTHLKKTAIGNDMSQLHQVVFDFQEKNLDEHRLFTKCPLTEESAFLWFNLCEFCQKSNITYKVETKESKIILIILFLLLTINHLTTA